MEETLDEIIDTMETLVEEYDEQEVQLGKMKWTLSHLKYGYNSLRQQLSNTECSASEVFTSAGLLSEHIEQSTMSVENIDECLEQSETSLDALEPIVHVCGEGAWELVVDHDYSNPTADDCPDGWEQFTDLVTNRRFCARASDDFSQTMCDSAFFILAEDDCPYSKVCGKIVGYGDGMNNAFSVASTDIDTFYVNGLSVTHGSPRQHVWTLAIGVYERGDLAGAGVPDVCPCHPAVDSMAPPFVGNDYFCESGSDDVPADLEHHLDDPLWDGRQCFEDCCIGSPFVKTLANGPTTDPLEIRICNVADENSGNILVEKIKIYVQ